MRSKFFLSVLVVFLGSAFSANAEIEKIGVVDIGQAMREVKDGKKATSQLETTYNKMKKEIEKREQELRTMKEEFDKKSLVWNEKTRGTKQGELQSKLGALQELTMKSQAEFRQKEQELTAPIVEKLKGLIEKYAKDKGYSMILEKNGNGVLFAEKKHDLTSEIVGLYEKSK